MLRSGVAHALRIRRNAQRSTGPRTEGGKKCARRNALRHGLTAGTLVKALENEEDYNAFETAIFAALSPVSIVD